MLGSLIAHDCDKFAHQLKKYVTTTAKRSQTKSKIQI